MTDAWMKKTAYACRHWNLLIFPERSMCSPKSVISPRAMPTAKVKPHSVEFELLCRLRSEK